MSYRGNKTKGGCREDEPWCYEDGTLVESEERPCTRCGLVAEGLDAPDPCLGYLPGVKFGCCGHGEEGYISFENDIIVRGPLTVDDPDFNGPYWPAEEE